MAAHRDPFRVVRIPLALMARADRLVPKLPNDPVHGPVVRASSAAVVRIALMRGLDVLEQEWGVTEEADS